MLTCGRCTPICWLRQWMRRPLVKRIPLSSISSSSLRLMKRSCCDSQAKDVMSRLLTERQAEDRTALCAGIGSRMLPHLCGSGHRVSPRSEGASAFGDEGRAGARRSRGGAFGSNDQVESGALSTPTDLTSHQDECIGDKLCASASLRENLNGAMLLHDLREEGLARPPCADGDGRRTVRMGGGNRRKPKQVSGGVFCSRAQF